MEKIIGLTFIGMVPMDIIDAGIQTVSDVKQLLIAFTGLVAVVVVVIAAIRAGLTLAVLVKAGISAAILLALVGGLLVKFADAGKTDIGDRLEQEKGAVAPNLTLPVDERAGVVRLKLR